MIKPKDSSRKITIVLNKIFSDLSISATVYMTV